mmetsp:Transcript_156528/g.380101  ORF Transcript_156528/g.380101 Transcript_156528/m.380101 type:complete len:177 (-) Transcript_156528:401-931(-)
MHVFLLETPADRDLFAVPGWLIFSTELTKLGLQISTSLAAARQSLLWLDLLRMVLVPPPACMAAWPSLTRLDNREGDLRLFPSLSTSGEGNCLGDGAGSGGQLRLLSIRWSSSCILHRSSSSNTDSCCEVMPCTSAAFCEQAIKDRERATEGRPTLDQGRRLLGLGCCWPALGARP